MTRLKARRGRMLPAALFVLAVGFVPLPGPDPAGAGFEELDAAIANGVARRVYPGAVVIVGRADTILHARGFGRLSWSSSSRAPTPDSTLYDLASLTKVVATTSVAMILVDRGQLDLDSPVSRYLPRFNRASQRGITIRMLLDHTSGLRPYVEFYRKSPTRAGMISLILREEPVRTPGLSAVYSDVNALILGLLVEQVTGETLDQFTRRELFRPLGMRETGYKPSATRQRRAAPTFTDGGRTVAGLVHDRNARDIGGIAGHAGLFSTGMDLARFAQWWLHEGKMGDSAIVSPETMNRFLSPGLTSGTRLLGWDSPDPTIEGGSVFGSLLSTRAYGHTGWTGTQLWIDPERDLFVVLLTNRSLNPRVARSLRDLRLVRAQVADAAVMATSDCHAPHSTC